MKVCNSIFFFFRIIYKRQVDNSLVVHDPDLDFVNDDKMNLKFDIDLDLNQLLNETQTEDKEFPITVKLNEFRNSCKLLISIDCKKKKK